MVVSKKGNNRGTTEKTTGVLKIKDPFDQLIVEFGQKGLLNVCVVGIGHQTSVPVHHVSSSKTGSYPGEHLPS